VTIAEQTHVTLSSPRTDARVTFLNGKVYSAPLGTPLLDYVNAAYPPGSPEWPVIAAIVDGDLRELTIPIQRDVLVKPITLSHSDGHRIYRRSVTFLLTTAASELFPGVKIVIEHSVPSGGAHCAVVGRPGFTVEELSALRERMRAIVAEDVRIVREQMPLAEAIAMFEARGDDDKVRLLQYRTKGYLTVYTLRDNVDYFFGYMAPSTGSLQLFDLLRTAEGFVLLYPRPETPNVLKPYNESYQLEAVFHRTREWLEVMHIEDMGRLNEAIADGHIRDEVLVAEALHSRHIGEIAAMIADQHAQGVRLVLIAGPSSAGKTTFSKRLAVQLMAHGIQPYTLAMDNYFVNREVTPKDDSGQYDFEALTALDLARFNKDLLALMQCQRVQLPRFDFKLGRSLEGDICQLTNDHIIIAEGIHGLNPDLVPHIPPERVFRTYVSALTALNIDRHNRIPTTDIRLLRRIVRDATYRGYSAQDTLDRWESVRRGEKRNIFPYQENADVMFNSSLVYELAVLRPFAEPLLLQVEHDSPRYIEAKRLLAFLSWVRPTSPEYVPDDSLLREFIGGSILDTYIPATRQAGIRSQQNGGLNGTNGIHSA
jgi:uridine kinase